MIGPTITTIITTNTAQNIPPDAKNSLFPVSDYFGRKDDVFPAIYYIVKAIPGYNKSGQSMQNWIVTLLTMCTSYKESWNLSIRIKQAFEAADRQTIGGVRLTKVRVTVIEDEYELNINSYGQKIEIEIDTQTLKAS